MLLDFWATWCTGCKQEIPWFAEFQRKYGKQGLEVVGVSMDDGWPVVKEFLAKTDVPYRIVLGDDALMKKYGNENMPDMFLIDRQGKIAGVYRGMVNKDGVEKDLKNGAGDLTAEKDAETFLPLVAQMSADWEVKGRRITLPPNR